MSGALCKWYSLPDLQALGRRDATVTGDIGLQRLERLRGLLQACDGTVRASVRFRELPGGWLVAEFQCKASLVLQCQRCLEPMVHEAVHAGMVVLLESDAVNGQLPDRLESVTLGQGRFRPADLVEDELIMGMPLVPRHAASENCGPLTAGIEQDEAGAAPGADDRKFARLSRRH